MNDKAYKFLFRLGMTFILIWAPLALGAVPKRIWSITPILAIITVLTFMWLWRLNNGLHTMQCPIRKTGLDKPLFAFVTLAVVSFVFSIYKYDSFYALLRLLSYVAVFSLVVNNYNKSLRNYLIGLVICIGTGLSVYGLLQYFGFFSHQWWNPADFLASTYVNHNHFSGYLELVIPVTIGAITAYRGQGGKIKKILLPGGLIIMLMAFVFAQSRGAWLSLGISLFLMNIILVRREILKKRNLVISIVLVSLVFAFLYSSGGLVSRRIESIKEVTKGEASVGMRLAIWQGTVDIISCNPWLGTGIGTFAWGFPRHRPMVLANVSVHYAHNDYLHMAAEMGIFALPIMLLLLIRIIFLGLSRAAPVAVGCAIGILSLSLHGLVDFNFHIPANMILVAVCAAIIMKES